MWTLKRLFANPLSQHFSVLYDSPPSISIQKKDIDRRVPSQLPAEELLSLLKGLETHVHAEIKSMKKLVRGHLCIILTTNLTHIPCASLPSPRRTSRTWSRSQWWMS